MFARVLGELCGECGDDMSDPQPGQGTCSRNKHKPRVTRDSRCDKLNVKWTEIAQVGCDDRAPLSPRQRNEIGIWQPFPIRVLLDCLYVVAVYAKGSRNRW